MPIESSPMQGIDLERLERLAEALTPIFYFVMFLALVTALVGSTGVAFVLLLLGSGAHVVRAALEEVRFGG